MYNTAHTMGIKVFFHICAITRAEVVVKDMIRSIHFSGLYDDADGIYCYITGEPETMKTVHELLTTSGSKFRIMKFVPNDASYERFTLEDIHNHVDGSDRILYIHSKGVSYYHQDDPNRIKRIDDWRDLMLYYLVRHWRACIDRLEQCDTVGICFMRNGVNNEIMPHWCGNFWWSRGDYLLTLPTRIGKSYYDPEQGFLFVNNPRAYEMYPMPPINFYHERYEPYKYVDSRIGSTQN